MFEYDFRFSAFFLVRWVIVWHPSRTWQAFESMKLPASDYDDFNSNRSINHSKYRRLVASSRTSSIAFKLVRPAEDEEEEEGEEKKSRTKKQKKIDTILNWTTNRARLLLRRHSNDGAAKFSPTFVFERPRIFSFFTCHPFLPFWAASHVRTLPVNLNDVCNVPVTCLILRFVLIDSGLFI